MKELTREVEHLEAVKETAVVHHEVVNLIIMEYVGYWNAND